MTKQKLEKYEELQAAYQKEVDNEIDAGAQLAGMHIGHDESVEHYTVRVQDKIAELSLCKRYSDDARAAVLEFIKHL